MEEQTGPHGEQPAGPAEGAEPQRDDRVTVWAVPLGTARTRTQGDRGELFLDPGALRFRAERPDRSLRIPLEEVRRVKVVLGSPVMLVRYAGEGRRGLTAFYFAKPPPLAPKRGEPEPPDTTVAPPAPFSGRGAVPSRRKVRSSSIASLIGWNRIKKGEIRRWARRIRTAAARARRGA